MSPAAGAVSHSNRVPKPPTVVPQPAPAMMSESFAKDAIIAWFRGEFAAANAMIDALCNHLVQIEGGGGSTYESVFSAIHQRRLNWIPILQMQKYYSIAEVTLEIQKVAEMMKGKEREHGADESIQIDGQVNVAFQETDKLITPEVIEDESTESAGNGGGSVAQDEDSARDDSPKSGITDVGSQEVQQPMLENLEICSNHEDSDARRALLRMTKGFVAKEPMKGHMVNVVRGLKLYEDVFTDNELSKLTYFVNELRVAGQNGELSGETFLMYNQQMKGGNKRELIQLGAPIFGPIKEDATSQCPKSHIEPIPVPLQGVIDHLIRLHLITENRKPNSCIINFFDEGEFSQPFLKPPHLEQPITTLLLSKSEMAFGRTLVCDSDGNYKGPLMLSLKEGSLLVMRGYSADMARHAMCSSLSKRISITFFKVRTDNNSWAIPPPTTGAMTLWQPGFTNSHTLPNVAHNGYETTNMIPKWGVLRTPLIMLAPVRPMVLSPKRIPHGGTGVFLPWTVRSRPKPARHLPPRAQKGRFLALPSPVESHKAEASSDVQT